MALLKPKTATKTKTISVRVPLEVAAELDDIKRQADQHGFSLDVADVVERALIHAVRAARTELAAMTASETPRATV
ncbi:MAG: hypothetical protein IPH08_04235 [Rhodocyclaceae bacterium]|jgi:hypothetical protein|nr:hypothetical protein [Rhodocyclaceae bacterium]